MPFVERDQATGSIKGCYAQLQAGIAEEWLAEDDPAVTAYRNPPPTVEQQRIAAVKANARRKALITAIQNNDDVGLIAAAAARYPGLTGDQAKFAADAILLIAGMIRS